MSLLTRRRAGCLLLLFLGAIRAQATNGAVQLAPGNGIWLRSETQIVGNEAQIVSNVGARGIKHLFLFSVGMSSSGYAQYGKFLQTAHGSNMTVHAICATRSNVTNSTDYADLQDAIDQVIAYNNTTNAASRFDGVQMDVEGWTGSQLLTLLQGVSVPSSLYFSADVQANEFNSTESSYSNMLATTSLDMLIPMIYIMDGLDYSGGNLTYGYSISGGNGINILNKTQEIINRLPANGRMMTGLSCYDYETAVYTNGGENFGRTGGYWGSQMAFSSGTYAVPYMAAHWPLVSATYSPVTGISSYRFNYGGTNWWDINEMTPIGVGLSIAAANAGGGSDPRYVGAAAFLYSTIFDSTSQRKQGLTMTNINYPDPEARVQILNISNNTARLRVTLTNANPAEAVLGDSASCGVHLQLPPGATFISADAGSFHAAIPFDSAGNQLGNVIGARVLELRRGFFENLSVQGAISGDIYVTALSPFAIQYRAWMTAKDSVWTNGSSVAPYIARSPDDIHYNVASKFLTYATFSTNVGIPTGSPYAAAILADAPVFYARFSETGIVTTSTPFIAANSGTVGASATGVCLATNYGVSTTILGLQSGALNTSGNTALAFSSVPTNPIVVLYRPEWNVNHPFSVELWLKGGTNFSCPASSVQYNEAGWLLYQQDSAQATGNGWCFRVYNNNSSNPRVDAKVDMLVDPNTWYHIVGVYDGANALLYVNGVLSASAALGSGYSYVPNPSATNALTWGARSGFYSWPYAGMLDEAAFYTNALTAAQIAAHYTTAKTDPANYPGMVLSLNPPGYWRFNDAITPPVVTNSGIAGADINGAYFNWSTTIPEFASPSFPGMETTNSALELFGTNGQVLLPPLNLNTNTVTVECWLKRDGAQAGYAGLVMHRNANNSGGSGLDFYNTTSHLGYWWNGIANTYTWDSGLLPPDGQWTYAALTISPSQAIISMCDGTTWSSATNNVTHANQPFAGLTRIGYNAGVNGSWFNGQIDEVAIYDSALSQPQLRRHALIAFGNTNQPLFSRLPVSQTVQLGDNATFGVAADGAPTIGYQWMKNGSNLAGAMGQTLSLAAVDYTDAGQYSILAANDSGAVMSPPATLTVLPPPEVTNLTYRIMTSGPSRSIGLIWPSGNLYSATNLAGPWAAVPGASAPYFEAPIDASAPSVFFEIR